MIYFKISLCDITGNMGICQSKGGISPQPSEYNQWIIKCFFMRAFVNRLKSHQKDPKYAEYIITVLLKNVTEDQVDSQCIVSVYLRVWLL